MLNHQQRASRSAAIVAALSLIGQSSGSLLAAAIQQEPPAAKPAPAPGPIDGGWPRSYDLPRGGSIIVYQPQVASWENQSHLVAFSAVSHRATAGDRPSFGTIKLEAETKVALPDFPVERPAILPNLPYNAE